MGHFCCFLLHFFQLGKPKLEKCTRVEEKSCGGRIFEFLFFFQDFQNFKNGRKNQNASFYKFFVLLKSANEQKIMSIEQFLLELLDFKCENWTYF